MQNPAYEDQAQPVADASLAVILQEVLALRAEVADLKGQRALESQLAFSFEEVGALLGGDCDAKTVRREWEAGRLAAVKVRGLRRVTKQDLERYVTRLRCEQGSR